MHYKPVSEIKSPHDTLLYVYNLTHLDCRSESLKLFAYLINLLQIGVLAKSDTGAVLVKR
jgi:hypothetical protein